MKLNAYDQNVLVSGGDESSQFTAEINGAAFTIMSDGIYEHKIPAIVREVCHNARDSHIQAGIPDVPFRVVLPNKFNQNFIVEDRGIGLDDDGVRNVFSAYFKSTKNHTNELVGGFGLGAKTPFCYSNSFFITAIKDFVKKTYVAYIGDSGIPELKCLSTEDDPALRNGVTIKVPVDENDHRKFQNEAAFILSFFDTRPIVDGGDDFEFYLSEEQYEKLQTEGMISFSPYSKSNLYSGEFYAMMDGVCYLLPRSIVSEKADDMLSLLTYGRQTTIFRFEPGEVFPAASRESLSMKGDMEERIEERIDSYVSTLVKETQEKVDQTSSVREAIEVVLNEYDNRDALRYFHKNGKKLLVSFNKKRRIHYKCRAMDTTSAYNSHQRFTHLKHERLRSMSGVGLRLNQFFGQDDKKIFFVSMNEGDKKTPFKKYVGDAILTTIREENNFVRGGERCYVFDYVLSEHKKKRIETLFGEDNVVWVDWKRGIPEKGTTVRWGSDLDEKTDTSIYGRIIEIWNGDYAPTKANNFDLDPEEYDLFYVEKDEADCSFLPNGMMKEHIDSDLNVVIFVKTKRNERALMERGIPHFRTLVERFVDKTFDRMVDGKALNEVQMIAPFEVNVDVSFCYLNKFLHHNERIQKKLDDLNEHFDGNLMRNSTTILRIIDQWLPGTYSKVMEAARDHDGLHYAKALGAEIHSDYGMLIDLMVDTEIQSKMMKCIDFCLKNGYHDKHLAIINNEGESQ